MNLFISSLLAILLACAKAANLDPVELGAAGGYALLAGAAVTSTGLSIVTGDIGVWPGTAFTGFGPGAVTGALDIGTASAAQGDLTIAYNEAAGKAVSLGGILSNQDLGGMTLLPGVYKFDVGSTLGPR
jgi:hypothetical protein